MLLALLEAEKGASEIFIQIRADFFADAVTSGPLKHIFNFGAEYSWDKAEYKRADNAYVHASATLSDDVVCAQNDPACADGEQYFGKRNVYLAQDQDADINHFAAYLEDQVVIGPVEIRPGGRISHDDFLDNTNVAHRLAGSWDILENGRTVLIGGYNRYYGEALLTYKLREAIVPYLKQTRSLDSVTNQLSCWRDGENDPCGTSSASSATLDKYSDLDTPYSDEWTIGIAQQFLGGTLELNYLERQNEDQFAKEKVTENINGEDTDYYVLNNNGSSEYESVKVSWERQWQKHYLHFNYTYSDQESTNESYDDAIDEEIIEDEIWYNGSLISSDELPRLDYNREHMLNIIYTGKLPWNFTFTNVTQYLGEYQARNKLNSTEKTALGIPTDLTAYEEVTRPDYWIFDWRLDWKRRIYRNQDLLVSLEVNNVFDRTPSIGEYDGTYALGRQFWLGMSYSF
jgi:hypothetical protein